MLKKTLVVMSLLAFTAVYPAWTAYGVEQGAIELISIAEVDVKAVSPTGAVKTERMEAAKAKVVPGDVVIFTTAYRHIGKEPAEKAVIDNPVPEHTVYVDGSAQGKGTRIEFSADNGKTYSAAKTLKAVKDGKTRPAVAADYTHVRWTFDKPLKPGAKGSVSFRAKVK